VQLSDSTATTSSVLAATPTAVKSAYDLANGAIPKTLTTTTGDVIYASGANTPARLGIGTSGQVLTVAGGVPTWAAAGGSLTVTQIANGTLSGSSVTISSLSAYDDLYLSVWNVSGFAASMMLRVNNSTSSVYNQQGNAGNVSESKRINSVGGSEFYTYYSLRSVGGENAFLYRLTNCKSAGFTNVQGTGGYDNSAAVGCYENWQAVFRSAAAVSSLVILPSSGNFSGGTYTLWGA
jgi:hypothetical protein